MPCVNNLLFLSNVKRTGCFLKSRFSTSRRNGVGASSVVQKSGSDSGVLLVQSPLQLWIQHVLPYATLCSVQHDGTLKIHQCFYYVPLSQAGPLAWRQELFLVGSLKIGDINTIPLAFSIANIVSL